MPQLQLHRRHAGNDGPGPDGRLRRPAAVRRRDRHRAGPQPADRPAGLRRDADPRRRDTTTSYYVDGGFVQVADNVVSVLTNRAVPADALDAAVAAEQLATARQRTANTPELLEIRDRSIKQARAQLRIAGKKSGSRGH